MALEIRQAALASRGITAFGARERFEQQVRGQPERATVRPRNDRVDVFDAIGDDALLRDVQC